MSTQKRRTKSTVIEQLLRHPEKVSFFQAVRLLERSAVFFQKTQESTNGEYAQAEFNKQAVGNFSPPSLESVRFTSQLTLGFPDSDIDSINKQQSNLHAQEKAARIHWHVVVNFLGLNGSTGVLPFHYSELIFQRLKLKDESLKKFLDLFQHRTISLFYKAGTKYRLPLSYEKNKLQPTKNDKTDGHTHALLSLIGLGTGAITNLLQAPYESQLYFSGLLSQKSRPGTSLKQMLSHYFQVPIKIDEFVGEWQELIDDVRSRLPTRDHPKGQNSQLGRSVILGAKGWFAQGKIRVVLGPLDEEQYQRFAPGTKSLQHLNALVKSYTGSQVESEYLIKVSRHNIPHRIQLNQKSPPTIGWNSWLSTKQNQCENEADTLNIRISSGRMNS